MILVFTGNGKGKTTAALGIAFRAAGHGLRTLVVQFLKGMKGYGELAALDMLRPLVRVRQFGRPCPFGVRSSEFAVRSSEFTFVFPQVGGEQRPNSELRTPNSFVSCATCHCPCHVTPQTVAQADRKRVRRGFEAALSAILASSTPWDIIVLDEALCLVPLGLAAATELVNLARRYRAARRSGHGRPCALVFTGRPRCAALERIADLVTLVSCRKHHSSIGMLSVPGVDR